MKTNNWFPLMCGALLVSVAPLRTCADLSPIAREMMRWRRTQVTSDQAQQRRVQDLRESVPETVPNPEQGIARQELKPQEEERQQGFTIIKIQHGDPNRKELALTFDDGPHPAFTPRLLDLLKQLNIHATFFLVGEKVDQAPYLLPRMLQEGHDVANHTYHHVNLKKIPTELVENEIRLDNDAIRRADGQQPTFFRPPGGQYNPDVVKLAEQLKMVTVLWTDDPLDYASPGAEVIEDRLLRHVRPGAVILLHDGIEQTFRILPDFVARMRSEGYRFVTLTEMARHLEAMHPPHRNGE